MTASPDTILLWMDFETTGLDHSNLLPLELGIMVTTSDMQQVLHDPTTLFFDENFPALRDWTSRDPNDDYARQLAIKTGLYAEMEERYSLGMRTTIKDVEQHVMSILAQWPDATVVLSGSGVDYDRRIIDNHIPEVGSRLAYYKIDAGVVRRLIRFTDLPFDLSVEPWTSTGAHRGVNDIINAWESLKLFTSEVKSSLLKSEHP